ncbi:hypothetical protein SAMN04488570_1894 [Nocardioides scoriae]|uniref:Uncharacterized protein n=1 Tax=Nocardioides scoriae TaxID=642780 RepID=A0A1H1S912_9ACTN|nr:hypothetical protein [Nocardioides scoriae]SDS44465.1 hypothetical protein SAMN04488570_1894 [Nocardioides scoriae]
MSVPLPVVVAASALVSSPVAWLLHRGLLTGQDAVERVLVLAVVTWLALNVLALLAFPDPPRPSAVPKAPETDESGGQPVSSDAL